MLNLAPTENLCYKSQPENSYIDILSFQADLIKFFTQRIYMETGFKYSDVSTKYIQTFLSGPGPDNIEVENGQYNNFRYRERRGALYANGVAYLGNWFIQGGLRGELTFADIRQLAEPKESHFRKDMKWLPVLYFGKIFTNSGYIGILYNTSIRRPPYGQLNPFTGYISEMSRRIGNPYLESVMTHKLSLRTLIKYKYMFILSATRSDNLFQEHNFLGEDGIFYQQTVNDGKMDQIEFFVNIPIRAGLWTSQNTMDVSWLRYKSSTRESCQWQYYISTRNIFNWNRNFSTIFTAMFRPHTKGLYLRSTKDIVSLDLSCNYSFLNNSFSLQFGVRDILNANGSGKWYYSNGVESSIQERVETSRTLFIGLTYNIANGYNKKKREKKHSLDDEKNRI